MVIDKSETQNSSLMRFIPDSFIIIIIIKIQPILVIIISLLQTINSKPFVQLSYKNTTRSLCFTLGITVLFYMFQITFFC